MGISQKGQMFYSAWYNGVEFDRAYFNGLRILGRPDDTPYLLAKNSSPKTIIKQGPTNILCTNNYIQVLKNTLENVSEDNLKFNISFKVHGSVLDGTYRLLLDMQGIVQVWTQNNAIVIRASWNNFCYELPTSILDVNDFNDISFVGDGSTVTLTANNHNYTIQLKPQAYPILLYSGFARNKYLGISAAKFDLSAENWKFGIGLYSPRASVARTNYLFGPYSGYYGLGMAAEFQYDSAGYYHLGWGLSSNNSTWNMGWIQDNTYNFAPSSWYWLIWQRSGNNYQCLVSTDAINYILYTSRTVEGNPYHNANAKLQLGNTANNSSYPWDGGVAITDTFFERNGIKLFDGATAVAGTDYTVNGSLTSGTYSRTIYVYPNITTTTLRIYRKIDTIKEVVAEVVED